MQLSLWKYLIWGPATLFLEGSCDSAYHCSKTSLQVKYPCKEDTNFCSLGRVAHLNGYFSKLLQCDGGIPSVVQLRRHIPPAKDHTSRFFPSSLPLMRLPSLPVASCFGPSIASLISCDPGDWFQNPNTSSCLSSLDSSLPETQPFLTCFSYLCSGQSVTLSSQCTDIQISRTQRAGSGHCLLKKDAGQPHSEPSIAL